MPAIPATFCLIAALLAAEAENPVIQQWAQLYRQRAEAITAVEERSEPVQLELHPNALLRYTNPVRPDEQHGSVHLWLDRGIPRVIAAVWSAEDRNDRAQRNLCYEFHSLSDAPLTVAIENSDVTWRPRAAGLEWIALKDAPVPPKSRALRLTQMRRFAAGWQALGQPNEAELRVLPQPLYRYPEDVAGPLDGAIFAFVMGTDPELFVVVEAWKDSPGHPDGWRISPARLTGTPLTLKVRDGEELWSSPNWEHFARDRVYDFLYGIERLTAADLPEVE